MSMQVKQENLHTLSDKAQNSTVVTWTCHRIKMASFQTEQSL